MEKSKPVLHRDSSIRRFSRRDNEAWERRWFERGAVVRAWHGVFCNLPYVITHCCITVINAHGEYPIISSRSA